jgi:hypothetical protein
MLKVVLCLAFLCSISTCFAEDFYLNPDAVCTPPFGCQFSSPSTWLNTTTIPSNNDNVYIIAPSNRFPNETLIIISNVPPSVNDTQVVLHLSSLVLQNVNVVFEFSSLDTTAGVLINSSVVNLANSSALTGGPFNIYNATLSLSTSYLSTYAHAATIVDSFITLEESIASLELNNATVQGGGLYAANSTGFGMGFSGYSTFIDVDIAAALMTFANVVFQSGSSYQIGWINAYSLSLGAGVQLNSTGVFQVTHNATLAAGSLLRFINVTYSTINEVIATGPATIIVDASEINIGDNIQSDLTNVPLIVQGSSLVHAHSILFGQITTSSSDYLSLDLHATVSFSQSVNFNGKIYVSALGNLLVNAGVAVTVSDCINSASQITVYGQVICATTGYQVGINSLTAIYGQLISPSGVTIGSESVLAVLNGLVVSPHVIITGNSVLSLSGGGVVVSTTGSVLIEGDSVLQISNGTSGVIASTLDIVNSALNADSVTDTLQITGNLILNNSAIAVVLDKHVLQNGTFIVHAEGNVSIYLGQLQVIGNKDAAPESTTQYNLINSFFPINGSLPQAVTVASDDIGSVEVKQPNPNQITFEFIPAVGSSGGLPVWAYVLIGVGGAIVLGVIIFVSYRLISRRKYQQVE